ncbi:MAG: Rpn family recombination-promoting nuclease/putative transposase [Chloroflexi bacterium]|nr:Rpn family recombination-promoting nuclease/putative transposase [Chloroflexota bacterium]
MTATIHDSGYKRLFSNKTIFRQLIETFVEEVWVSRLDFDRGERLDKSFVSEHYKETEADIIYKVPLRDSDKVIYLCLLIEFQSDVQRFMVLRSLHYRCNFYMDFVLSNKNVRGLLLPAMFQLVLYNGDEKWTAPTNLDQLIESEIDLGSYGLHFEHLVIAENAYGKEWLAKVDNIITTLFLAEAHYDLPLLMEKLLSLYDTEPDRQAVMLFVNWFRQLAAHGRLKNTDFAQIEEQYLTREEVKSMLVRALEREREIVRQEGIDIGKKEGIDIGKQAGIEERNHQIAQAMVANGFDLATIAQVLALALPEVERLLIKEQEPGQGNIA